MPPARLLVEELGSAYRRATTTPGGTNCRSELALYSLTERAHCPFRAEPTQTNRHVVDVGRSEDLDLASSIIGTASAVTFSAALI